MLPGRISDLLAPFVEAPLSPAQLDQVSTYLDLLLRWNARINLTAIRAPEAIITRHFGESFFLARHLFPTERAAQSDLSRQMGSLTSDHRRLTTVSGSLTTVSLTTGHWPLTTVLDIGSGAGFPALPLKIFAPQIHLTLIESNHKKSAFLREVIRSLSFSDVNVITDRAENVRSESRQPRTDSREPTATPQIGHEKESEYDLVTFRAVEKFDAILPLAHSFLARNGILALLIGTSQLPALQSLADVLWNTQIHVPQSQQRIIAIGKLKSI
jgi:16S rRNA (guanine527-N7)-methyltransferase